MKYKDFVAIIEFDDTRELLSARIIGVDGGIKFYADSMEGLNKIFFSKVDEYLSYCGKNGLEPFKHILYGPIFPIFNCAITTLFLCYIIFNLKNSGGNGLWRCSDDSIHRETGLTLDELDICFDLLESEHEILDHIYDDVRNPEVGLYQVDWIKLLTQLRFDRELKEKVKKKEITTVSLENMEDI